jgi:hypothetical protein
MGRLIEHEATGPRKLDESDIDPEKGAFARDGSGSEASSTSGESDRTGLPSRQDTPLGTDGVVERERPE